MLKKNEEEKSLNHVIPKLIKNARLHYTRGILHPRQQLAVGEAQKSSLAPAVH